ncbi:MAG: hypothetical protein RL266_2015 [Bacteroidota bacterium]|jgi:hypothetical protein
MRWLTIILSLVAVSCFGQAPGYMGKKFLITGEVSFLNALFNPNHNMNEGLDQFSFNFRSTTDLDYVIARNGTIGATFDVFYTGMKYDWDSPQYEELLVPNIDARFDHGRIFGYGYGINYKIFRNPSKGGIAPVGSYAKFDVMLLDVRTRPFDKAGGAPHSKYSDRFFSTVISITFGRQRILWDFLVLRTGIQVGIVPFGISPYLQSLDKGIERGSQQQDLRAHTEARLMTYYLLNVNFGVGFLLPFRKSYKTSN